MEGGGIPFPFILQAEMLLSDSKSGWADTSAQGFEFWEWHKYTVRVQENSQQLQQQSQDASSGGGKSPEKAGATGEVLTRLYVGGVTLAVLASLGSCPFFQAWLTIFPVDYKQSS